MKLGGAEISAWCINEGDLDAREAVCNARLRRVIRRAVCEAIYGVPWSNPSQGRNPHGRRKGIEMDVPSR